MKVGDEVICVDVAIRGSQARNGCDEMPLVLHREYVVQGLSKCGSCGQVMLDVGIPCDKNNAVCICGNKTHIPGRSWFFLARRFVNKDELSFVMDEVSEILNKERV